MVCVRLLAVKFKRRVQVTVLAGAFVRFAAFEVPGVSLAFWARGRCRDSGHRAVQFESQTVLGGSPETYEVSCPVSKVGQEASALLGGGSRSKQTTTRWVKKQAVLSEVGQEANKLLRWVKKQAVLSEGVKKQTNSNVVRCQWTMKAAARDDSSPY